jgi:tryptophan-rich sensory protein
MKKFLSIIIAIAICFGVGFTAQYFQSDALTSWYPFLEKSSITPPNDVFPIAWGIIYLCMGISIGLIWHKPTYVRFIPLWLFIGQLFLNFMWSILFFAMQSPILGFFDILLLDILVFLYTIHVYSVNRLSAWLFIPYIIWLVLATYLNVYIIIAN